MSEEDSEFNQKSITELQNEINEYQKRERVYIVELFLKDKQIQVLESYKRSLISKVNSNQSTKDYSDPIMLNEFKNLRTTLKEKDALLLSREETLLCVVPQNTNPNFKKFIRKCSELQKENYDLLNFPQNSIIENMRLENSLEKSQIEQLMLKLKESESIMNDYQNDLDECNEAISFLGRKIKGEELILSNLKNKK